MSSKIGELIFCLLFVSNSRSSIGQQGKTFLFTKQTKARSEIENFSEKNRNFRFQMLFYFVS